MRKFNHSWGVLLLLIAFLLTLKVNVFAQDSQKGVVGKDQKSLQPLTTILKKIGKMYGTSFVYEEDLLDKITVSFEIEKDNALEEQLKKLLYPRGLVFLYVKKNYYAIVSDRNRSISPRVTPLADTSRMPAGAAATGAELMVTPATQPGGKRITGQVTDQHGRPLSPVNVIVRGRNIATTTTADGRYILDGAFTKGAVLVFSFVGYGPQESMVKDENAINIVLKESSVALEEVIVVGYGEKKKENLTASISTVNSKELNENHSSASVSDMLAGRLAGLYVQKSDGTVGSGSDLKIRGLSTFNNSSPLVVVDGIPGRSIDDLNPTDIDAVSVLKDAAAIAVYGARAANGVILVTTKKGRNGKPEITFASNLIDQSPTDWYKKMNAYQYAQSYNEGLQNEGAYSPVTGIGFSDAQVQKFKDGTDPNHYPNTDWLKIMTKSHIIQNNYNLSASGGNENSRYFLSVGYMKNGGFVPVEYYTRWNFRSNLEARIAKGLTVNFNLAGVLSKTNGEGVYGMNYVIKQAYQTPATRVNQFTNGTYAFVPEQRGNSYLQSIGKTGFNTNNNNTLNSTLSLQYDLPWIKGLFVKGTAAYDKGYGFAKQFALPYDQYSIDDAGNYSQLPSYPSTPYLSENFNQSQNLTLEGSLQYNGEFARNHVSGLLLYTQTASSTDQFGAGRRNFVSGALPQLSLGDPSQATNNGTGTQSARQGVVGRLSYDYALRYLMEFDFRYDGSDIFPPGHRFGLFPSLSGGWVISNEPFFKEPFKGLDFLKIRGSWGQLGNDRVSPYQFLSTYSLVSSPGGYSFGGPNPVFYQSLQANVLPNPSFTWERATMTNVGIEAHYRRDLFTLEADYFHKLTRDILAVPNLQVPSVVGLALPNYNDAAVENSGLEISLGHAQHFGKFSYYIQTNVSFNNNKIVSFPESKSIPSWQKVTGTSAASYGAYNGINTYGTFTGRGYRSQGLYQNQQEVSSGPTPLFQTVAPGDIRYADIDKDGSITPNDMVVIGNHYFPGIQYGIRWGVRYQGLECNVLLQGSGNVQAYNYAGANGFYYLAGGVQALDHWTPLHANASYPRLWVNDQNNGQNSDFWIVNTAYMRVKNIELAYNLSQKILQRAGIRNLRISLTANNMITFSKFKLYDPEAASAGDNAVSAMGNPLMKSFTAGVSLQF